MRILILEDSIERIKTFKKFLNTKEHDLYFFDNVKDAILAVNNMEPFDAFFIDHDLDNKVYVNSLEENTGYQFAKFLFNKKINGQFIVHSMNNVGAQNIINILPGAIHVPFPLLFKY